MVQPTATGSKPAISTSETTKKIKMKPEIFTPWRMRFHAGGIGHRNGERACHPQKPEAIPQFLHLKPHKKMKPQFLLKQHLPLLRRGSGRGHPSPPASSASSALYQSTAQYPAPRGISAEYAAQPYQTYRYNSPILLLSPAGTTILCQILNAMNNTMMNYPPVAILL